MLVSNSNRLNSHAGTTGERILIEWTLRLEQVIAHLCSFPKQHSRYVFTNDKTQPLTANNCAAAWSTAMRRCIQRGTLPEKDRPQFRDLRRKALTDVARSASRGKEESQAMGAHASMEQTLDYINSPEVFISLKTKASR